MASATPLRPGPARPDAAEQIRDRILDAATECLLAEGLDARLHAAIAERAGISRPTVYKYVGDQAAIVAAILDRELDRFFGAAMPVLQRSDDLQAHLVGAIVFVVDYARDHALLQKALREHPEIILPALTTASGPLVERVVGLFEDQLARALSRSASPLDPRSAAEWGYRIVISLVTTPTAALAREDTRAYVESLVRLMAIVDPD
ncbi:TetR/AcrR family transcriptional regulator [Nocardioides sp. MH1]|uniref:TetR/AcrR family transcriptional regulator n=1 Tax=Nocardioides sp. MH1 TaxID=3242490 RepID=UPI0035230445